MEIPVLFGGQVIIEQVFSWPGLGLMTMRRNHEPGLSGYYGCLPAVCNRCAGGKLITEYLYALADPTIQAEIGAAKMEKKIVSKKIFQEKAICRPSSVVLNSIIWQRSAL